MIIFFAAIFVCVFVLLYTITYLNNKKFQDAVEAPKYEVLIREERFEFEGSSPST